jgi:phytoene dehydrogenase-like protein
VSAVYLTDHNKKVLLLEKENYLGGLAAYREDRRGFTYDRGASYWTKAFN